MSMPRLLHASPSAKCRPMTQKRAVENSGAVMLMMMQRGRVFIRLRILHTMRPTYPHECDCAKLLTSNEKDR